MSSKSSSLMILLSIIPFTSGAGDAVERLFWDKVPLRITLPVGKERLVTFSAAVRLGMPGTLAAKLRTQSNQGTVYWLAHEVFDIQRIEVREIKSNRIYLIDLSASKKSGLSDTPIEVINKQTEDEQTSVKRTAKKSQTPGYVALTRFAAQQLYAPARLLKAAPGIHRVSVARHTSTHLIRGEQIKAIPVAGWQSGSLYVTAVALKNTSQQYITLDPRALRGAWRTATFQHTRLHPAGSEADTTAVYLISDRPFHEVL
jgi:integrating conjugative element protein (TIGR03749 family)